MHVDKLQERRRARIRKNLIDFIVYSTYLFIVCAAGHLSRDSVNGRTLEDILRLNNLTEPGNPSFLKILDDEDFYRYMKEVFIPVINSGGQDGHSETVTNHDEAAPVTLNKEIVLLGVPRLRQLRIKRKDGECPNEEFLDNWYSRNEDSENYSIGWTPDVGNPENLTDEETYWRFSTVDKTLSTPRHGELSTYDGSGYIAELDRTVNESQTVLNRLNETGWIDKCTKAIFVELSLYNPNLNIHTVIVLILEKSLSLHYIPKSEIHTWRFAVQDTVHNDDLFISDATLYIWIVIFILCLLYFFIFTVIHAFKSFRVVGWNAFKRFLLWVDVLIIVLGITVIWNHFSVSASFDAKVADYSAAEADNFVNFQIEQQSGERQIILFVFLTVLGIFKLWYLLVISSRFFFIIGFTFSITGPFMLGCSLIFFVLLMGSCVMARVHFGELFRYRTFGYSILTQIYHAGLRNVMPYEAFVEVAPIFGRVFYIGFTVFVVFLFINVMASVLTMGLQEAKETSLERSFRLSYSEYIWSRLMRIMPNAILKRFEKIGKYELPIRREEEMKRYFIPILTNHMNSLPVKRVELMRQIAIKLVHKKAVKIISKKEIELARKLRILKITEGRITHMELLCTRYIKKKLKIDSEKELDESKSSLATLESQCKTLEKKMEELMELTEKYNFGNRTKNQISKSNEPTPTSSKGKVVQPTPDQVTYLNEGPGNTSKKQNNKQ